MRSHGSVSSFLGRIPIFLVLLPLALACRTTAGGGKNASPRDPYVIDHTLYGSGDLPAVTLENREIFNIKIVNTKRACYLYNLVEDRPKSQFERSSDDSVAELSAVHDDQTIAYVLKVTLQPDKTADTSCSSPGAREWRIPVRSLWNLSASGGLAGHKLTNPVYFLEPATRDKPGSTTTPPEKEQGFIVRRNRDAEDEHSIGGAALLNLYLSTRGLGGVTWAPITFGLSVDQNRNDYLIGTSARLGSRAYVTLGRIFGSVNRLRDGFVIDKTFTTDSNALNSPPTRRDDAWFVGLHFSFLDQGVSNLFKTRLGIPVPTGTGGGAQQQQTNTGPSATPTSGAPGTPVTVKPATGQNFGASADNSTIRFGSVVTKSKDMGDKWKPSEIVVPVPDVDAGSVNIIVTKEGTALAPVKFEITAAKTLNVTPVKGKIGATVTIKPPQGENFGGTSDTSSVAIAGKTIKSTDITDKWKPDVIEITVPTGSAIGATKIVVLKDGVPVGSAPFEVQP